MVEMITELTESEDHKDVTSNWVLLWARQVEAQGTQTAVLNNLKVNQVFYAIQLVNQKRQKHKIHVTIMVFQGIQDCYIGEY